MATPSPTPFGPPDSLRVVGDFLFGSWLGQAITAAAVIALIAWIFKPLREWAIARLKSLIGRLRDIRITRATTISEKIEEAVALAVAKVREELQPAAPLEPAEPSEEELSAIRDEARHKAMVRDQWQLSTNRSREHGYVLRNYSARSARRVRLESGIGFEFLGPVEWDLIEEGESVLFKGRVAQARYWSAFDRYLEVHWTDDHGDNQMKQVQVDRRV